MFGENDNKLFFLDASADKIGIGTNTPGEKLEVIGNISASGNFIVNEITASGNISASGRISGLDYAIDGNILADMVDSTIALGYQNNTPISIGRLANPINLIGQVTASGNISSSGFLQGTLIKTDDGTNLLGGKRFITDANGYEFRDGTVKALAGLIGNHITASGNISASGTIIADTLTSNNIVFTPSATSIKIEAPDETAGSANGASLTIEAGNAFGSNFNGGDVTIQAGKGSGAGDGGNVVINAGGGIPSGSISLNAPSIIAASDTLVFGNAQTTFEGNITASGAISSSGTVESNGLILTSPDGTRYQIAVANDGTLSTSSI